MVDSPEQIIKMQHIDSLFLNLEELYKVNTDLVTELENRILDNKWDDERQLIGEIFVKMVKTVKHNVYLSNIFFFQTDFKVGSL